MTISPSLRAFLDLIAWSEGTSTSSATKSNGYDVIVSGPDGPEVFTDFSDHPFANRPPKIVREDPLLESTAAGRYQILYRYWKVYKTELGLTSFLPDSQDAVAIEQIKERGALEDIAAGEIELAIGLCSNIWASLPGNSYDQNARSMDSLLAKFSEISEAG